MPAFDVTVNPTTLEAKAGEKKSVVVTVTNKLGRPVTARASAVVDPATASAWVKAPPDAQKAFSQAATLDFRFGIEVPAAGPAGLYKVRIDVVDIEQPDDNFGQSPMIAVTVPKPPDVVVTNGGGGVPWWVWLVAALVILGVGFGIWKAFFSSKNMPDLVKKSFAAAKAALDDQKITIVRVDTLNMDTVAFKGETVIEQDPAGGTKLKPDSNSVRLVVQKNYAAVPVLVGQLDTEAAKRIGQAGLDLKVGSDCSTRSTADDNKVTSSSPTVGQVVAQGTPVTIYIREVRPSCPAIIIGTFIAIEGATAAKLTGISRGARRAHHDSL
jgi:hypothetical protein